MATSLNSDISATELEMKRRGRRRLIGAITIGLLDWKADRILARLEDPTHDRSGFLCFSPDGGQLVAAAHYDKAVHVWDLRRIQKHLAELRLEGDWPSYPPAAPPAATLRVRQDDAWRPAPPVVVLPPLNPKHRAATPQQIQDWIRQLGGDDAKASAEAAAALTDVGPPALAALQQAVSGPNEGLRRRVAEVVDRITVAEALAPTRVRLKLQDAPISAAAAALTRQSGVRVDFVAPVRPADPAKNLTLELDGVPFWEALDRLCDAGDLTYTIAPGRGVLLSQGPRTRKEMFADAGPFRLQATSWVSNRTVSLQGTQAPPFEYLSLNLMLYGDSRNAVAGVGFPGLQEAEDDAGASRFIDPPMGPAPDYVQPVFSLFPAPRMLALKPSDRRGGALKRVKGVLPVEVMTDRNDLATAKELGKAEGKTFAGDGMRLGVQNVQQGVGGGQQVTVSFVLDAAPGWAYQPAVQGFDLTDGQGRQFRPSWVNVSPVGPTRRAARPEDLAVMAGTPEAGFPGGLPWAALALNAHEPEQRWSGTAQFYSPEKVDLSTATFTFYRYRRVRTELPFEFHDLPLP